MKVIKIIEIQTGGQAQRQQLEVQSDEVRIGVYVCHCGLNIAGSVNCEEVAKFAASLPHVVLSKDEQYTCSDLSQETIKKNIKEHKLNRIVVASCSPRLHEFTFRKTCEEAGLNKYLFEMANIREHCSWVHIYEPEKATEKAKDLVRMAVAKAALLQPQEENEVPITKKTLIIGGGVAGIQAALDLADTGYKVYLVEKQPSIGGRMAQIDKTFPTMDCSICILAPKMSDVSRHKNIEMLTNSEVKKVKGYIGNFKVEVLKRPRYVTGECTACGECAEKCSVKVPSEFQAGLTDRNAIYTPFIQAVPRTWSIDKDHCMYLTKGTCYPSPVILPPEKWQEFTSENVGLVPEVNGVFQLFDGEKLIVLISGVPNLRKGLKEKLETVEKARYFTYEEHPMYTMRESELISKFLKEHNRLPELNDELADLF